MKRQPTKINFLGIPTPLGWGGCQFNYDRDTMTKKQQETIQHFEICAVRWSEQNPDMNCEELLEMMLERY